MATLTADPLFKTYAICSIILSVQMLVLAGLTPAKRAKHKKYLNPEDSKVSFKDATVTVGAEHEEVARVMRAHRNMNESLPMFFALGLIFILSGASPLGGTICLITFTAARVLHSIVYLKAVQPWRTAMYAIGSFALIGMMVQIVIALL